MKRKNVRIENLRIRLPKGFGAAEARRLAADLGDEIAGQIARQTAKTSGVRQIGNLDAGKMKTGGGADLKNRIARRIARIIGEKMK